MNSENHKVIKAILFDLGNVLIDIDFQQFIINTRLDNLLSGEEIFKKIESSAVKYEKGEISTYSFYKVFSEEFNLEIDFNKFKDAWCSVAKKYVDQMDKLIYSLSLRYPLFLLSNSNELHFRYIKENFPVLNYFKEYFLSYKIGHMKPEKEIYLTVLNKTGLSSDEIIFIDDKIVNIESAQVLGMDTIHFNGSGNLENLLRAKNIKI